MNATFDAAPGVTALFGPSGSGKSLTLAGIAGLLRPDTGTIRIGGTVMADAAADVHVRTQDRHIGMVFQHASLLDHRSPLDNVAIAAPDKTRAARREHAAEWLSRVGATHLAHSATRELSGGEQQRIALARALVAHPRVLLLDEPFSALDAPTRTQLRALVARLVDEGGLTALLVTHDLDDIVHLAQRVVRYAPGHTLDSIEPRAGRLDLEALQIPFGP